MSKPQLRVLVVQNAATPMAGVAALCTAGGADEAEFVCLLRGVEVLRAIGLAPDAESAHRSSVILTSGIDIVVVSLPDEIVRLSEQDVASGVETLATMGVPVLVLTGFGNEAPENFISAASWFTRHVRGVLAIDAPVFELAAALRAVHAGLIVAEPRVMQFMLAPPSRRARAGDKDRLRTNGEPPPLSTREREVLALLAAGLATKHIAHELAISAHTVKAHVESIFAKFGTTTRAEAVAVGVRRGEVML